MNLKDPALYFNRELSWLAFNERVLEEAEDETNPLLERVKFFAIFYTNLDEFFMIRVAGLKEQINANIHERSADGKTPQEQLKAIAQKTHALIQRAGKYFHQTLLPQLKKHQIGIVSFQSLSPRERKRIINHVYEHFFPLFTPIILDPAHPFPKIRGLGINLFVVLRRPFVGRTRRFAVVPVPPSLPRFWYEQKAQQHYFIPIEEIIKELLPQLFPNMSIEEVWYFRVTRNADLEISEAEADDLLKSIERELRRRRLGTIVRLEVHQKMPESRLKYLMQQCNVTEDDVYACNTYLSLDALHQLYQQIDNPSLKYPPFTPALHPKIAQSQSVFDAIADEEILLHHPYDSFYPVIAFLNEAAQDPKVVAIKQTLYRTSGDSPIVKALKEAAENGKQVTALIELKARFDEENNILWAKQLEQAGVNVIYGVLGLKTHCKMTMVLREEEQKLKTYIHLSTGNYNEKTAKVYTDLGFFTTNEAIGKDVAEVFNLLTGFSQQQYWRKLLVAPINMRQQFKRLIFRCMNATKAEIFLVMNALVDTEMIRLLYKASQKGVKIRLLIRGICCLRPGVKGVSENIEVRSIVGRFLEHSRVYWFRFDEQEVLFCGSADWMPRNLNRRVEVAFPIEAPALQKQVKNIIETLWKDNTKARQLQSDGSYKRLKVKGKRVNAQEVFLKQAQQRQPLIDTIPHG